MSINCSDEKKQEYENFIKNGGTITFEIDPEDIEDSRSFEQIPSIQPNLKTGFELRPTSLIDSPQLQAAVMVFGSQWKIIMNRVYNLGGNIIYKQLNNGKYNAICNIPKA